MARRANRLAFVHPAENRASHSTRTPHHNRLRPNRNRLPLTGDQKKRLMSSTAAAATPLTLLA